MPHSKENALKAANQMLAGIRKKHDENKFTYGTTDTVLCGKDPLDSVNGAEKIDLLQNVWIPKNHTTIMCHGFTLKGDGHVVAMMPVITPGSPVHHFHLHRCRNNKFFREFDNNPHQYPQPHHTACRMPLRPSTDILSVLAAVRRRLSATVRESQSVWARRTRTWPGSQAHSCCRRRQGSSSVTT